MKRWFMVFTAVFFMKHFGFSQLNVSFETIPSSVGGIVNINKDASVIFTSTSQNIPIDAIINWSFLGGIPFESNTLGPHAVFYDTPGIYEATLSINGLSSTIEVVVGQSSVAPGFEISSSLTNAGFSQVATNNEILIKYCGNAAQPYNGLINFQMNIELYPLDYQIIINWGDGTFNVYAGNVGVVSHVYDCSTNNSFLASVTVVDDSNCIAAKSYNIYSGALPEISVSNFPTNACTNTPFIFDVISNDVQGTTYTYSFSDSVEVFDFSGPFPVNLSHVFSNHSCASGANITLPPFNPNIYVIGSVTAENACGTDTTNFAPIFVSNAPVANINAPSTIVLNQNAAIENTSEYGFMVSANGCNDLNKSFWTITPNSGYVLNNGSLGDGSNPNWVLWINGSSLLNITFQNNQAYTVTLTQANGCGSSTSSITFDVVLPDPIAVNDTLTVSQNSTASINVLSNDLFLNPNEVTLDLITQPLYGTAILSQDGTLTYTNMVPLGCNGDTLAYEFCLISDPTTCSMAWVYIHPDIAPPTFDNCPGDIVIDADAGMCNALVNWTPITASSACSVFVTSSHSPNTAFPIGSTSVVHTAIDNFGNTSTCTFTVTVNEYDAPTILCPADTTLYSLDGSPIYYGWQTPIATDNCGIASTSFSSTPAGFNNNDFFPVGTTTVTYETFDFAGNNATCSFDINVEIPIQQTGITGKVYFDENADCILNNNDLGLNDRLVQLTTSQGAYVAQTYTNPLGQYQFIVPAGNYLVSTIPISNSIVCNNNLPVSVLNNQVNSEVNLGNQCGQPGFDISVNSIVPLGWVFPGQTHNLRIFTASMLGSIPGICPVAIPNNQISGELLVTIAGPVDYVAPFPNSMTPTSVSGNVLTYQIDNYALVNWNSFRVYLQTQTSAQSGDQVCVNAVFTSDIPGEVNMNNNTLNFCYAALNSYDPNIKLVSPVGDVLVGYEDDLIYTIYFQNTGDAPAFNITLVDTLSSNLNLMSFEKMDASHDCSVDIMGNVMTIHFPDIMLPDSTSNPEGSIGFFQYKIKPLTGLEEGESIENTAHIFFDFNEAIVTNTTVTTFIVEDESGLNELTYNGISIFPNPNNGSFTVKLSESLVGDAQMEIVDISGRVQQSSRIQLNGNAFEWQGDLNAGVYYLRLMDVNFGQLYVARCIIQ